MPPNLTLIAKDGAQDETIKVCFNRDVMSAKLILIKGYSSSKSLLQQQCKARGGRITSRVYKG